MKRMPFAATMNYPHVEPTSEDFRHETNEADYDFNHSLFVPLHYEKKYAYPLVVWLHSAGDNERQLKRVMPGISLRNYAAIAPRGTTVDPETDAGAYCWQQTDTDIIEAQWRLSSSIELVQSRYNINPNRVFIGGFGDGGTMALRLALRLPHLCAGAFSIGGPLPTTHAPLVNIEHARGLPMLLMHGNESRDYPSSQLCEDLRVLHAAGMGVGVRQYPAGDELTTQMLSDLDAWMMERVTGQSNHSSQPICDLGEWN